MAEATGRFHWADYVVTVACLLVSLGIGVFFAVFHGGQKTKEEYLVGNRRMTLGPVCLSLFVTFQSAISLIGIPSDVYNTGSMVLYIYVGISLSYVIGYFTVVPLIYPLHVTSVYEYLGTRFQSTAVRLLGTVTGMIQTMMYMSIALFSPALALQAAAGIPLWLSVAIVGAVGTIYTAIGGIKSVVWTDVFQTVIIFIGMASVLIKGSVHVGGFTAIINIADEGGRIIFDEINPDPRERHSVWSASIGMTVVWLVSCFNQSAVQRISALKSLGDAKKSYLLNIPLNALYGIILVLTGILLYAYVITIGCDPYQAGLINNTNQMMPYFVIHLLSNLPGMAGLYMSMLFSGALSTFSSGINSLAANTVEDLLAKCFRKYKDAQVTTAAKFIVVLYGAVSIGLAYLLKSLEGPVSQMAVSAFGACGGPILGMFFLGGAFPRGNKYGAFCGGVFGLGVSLWITIGSRLYGSPMRTLPPGPTYNCHLNDTASLVASNMTDLYTSTTATVLNSTLTTQALSDSYGPFSIYDISYLWIGPIGMIVSFLSGVIISLLTGPKSRKPLDPSLVFPFCRKICRMSEPIQFPKPDNSTNVVTITKWEKVVDPPNSPSAGQEKTKDDARRF